MDRQTLRFTVDQFTLPEHIKTIAAFEITKDYLIIITQEHKIYQYIYGKQDSLSKGYDIPSAGAKNDKTMQGMGDCRLFCDKSSNHVLLKYNGQMFYFNHSTSQLYDLPKLNNINVTSVAFNEDSSNHSPLDRIILGDKQSTLYEYSITFNKNNKTDKIKEKLTPLVTLITNDTTSSTLGKVGAITGLYLKNNHGRTKMTYVLITTHNRLYQFIGDSLQMLFSPMVNNPNDLDMSCIIFPSELKMESLSKVQLIDNDDGNHESMIFGWQCEAGFNQFSFNDEAIPFIDTFTITPYEKRQLDRKIRDTPRSIAHSKHHIFLLFKDGLVAISKISANIVYKYDEVDLVDIQYDPYLNVLWGRTMTSLYQLPLDVEESILWQDYIEIENYASAIDSISSPSTLKQVHRIIGDIYAEKNMLDEASVHYSKSNASFEDVCLKMYTNDKYDALLKYLSFIVNNRLSNQLKCHKSIILTMILQINLFQINSSTSNDQIPYELNKVVNFLNTNRHFLENKDMIYDCLLQYGFIEPYLRFAEITEDYESVVLYYITTLKIDDALEKFEYLTASSSQLCDVFNKYTQVLMKFNQVKTIELLLQKKLQLNIDANQLIFAMMKINHEQLENMCKYLHMKIHEYGSREKNMHNLYLYFLSQQYDNQKLKEKCLIPYLQKQLVNLIQKKTKREEDKDADREMMLYNIKEVPFEILFEIEYALKLFNNSMLISAHALVLAMKDKFTEAVKIALKHNEVDIAKFIAKTVEEKKLKKALWAEIFKEQIQKAYNKHQHAKLGNNSDFDADIQQCLAIIEESKVLKIEDVLVHMVDNIRIEKVKDQLKACLMQYEKNLGGIKKSIQDYHNTSNNIKEDLRKIKKKAIDLQYNSCHCDICHRDLKSEKLILFPCGHMFDKECILTTIRKYATAVPSAIEKNYMIENLMMKLNHKRKDYGRRSETVKKSEENTFFSGLINMISADSDSRLREKEQSRLLLTNDQRSIEDIQVTIDRILMEECVKCGNMIIESIKYPYHGDDYSWSLH